MTCKLALVGAGSMAREHLKAFADVPGVVLSGIHSRTRVRAEVLAREFGVAGVFDSIAELYAGTQADLVVVAVPELAVRQASCACFEFPWTAFLEKPPGYNLAEAGLIQTAAEGKKRTVYVGLNRRFLSSSQAVLNSLAQDNGFHFVHVQDQQSLAAAAAIGHPPEVVKNWMYANSIHVIDYLPFLGRGKIVKVERVSAWDAAAPGVVLAKITFDSGDLGLYEGLWHGPGPWAVTITSVARRWELRPLEQASFQDAGTRTLAPVAMHDWDKQFKPGFRLQADQVVAAVQGQPSSAVRMSKAMETMQLIQDIFGQ